jgi:hypothetical protein
MPLFTTYCGVDPPDQDVGGFSVLTPTGSKQAG